MTAAALVAGILGLITVHELGHLVAAKWAGMRVERFAVGIGPALWARTVGGTEYSLRALPLGGFCDVPGMSWGGHHEDPDPANYYVQPYRAQVAYILGGVTANVVLGFVLAAAGAAIVFLQAGAFDPLAIVAFGAETTAQATGGTVAGVADLAAGRSGLDALAGPLGIHEMAGQAIADGVPALLAFLGVVSVALGVLNAMPVPGLDGSWFAITTWERVTGRSLRARYETWFPWFGLAFGIVVMAVATLSDLGLL